MANSNSLLGDAAASVKCNAGHVGERSNVGYVGKTPPGSAMQQSQGIAAGTTILAPSEDLVLVYENWAMGFLAWSCESTDDDVVAGGSVASSRKRAAAAKSDSKRRRRNKKRAE